MLLPGPVRFSSQGLPGDAGGVVMSAIQDIFRTYGPEYLALYKDRVPENHKKVIRAICECRIGCFGTILYDCADCHTMHPVPCCCGNRHCPSCQQEKADEWLDKQMKKLLPTHYFLLTITLPEHLLSPTPSSGHCGRSHIGRK